VKKYIRLNITTEGQTESLIPEYQKVSSGSLLTDLISIDVLRAKCYHFNEWLTKLEILNY